MFIDRNGNGKIHDMYYKCAIYKYIFKRGIYN